MATLDTIGFLLGTWSVTRSIEDHSSGTSGAFTGTATLTEATEQPAFSSAPSGRARYEEAGELRFGSYRGPAQRTLDYERLENAAAMVYFADGRPFVDLDLGAGEWTSSHRCGEDNYEIGTTGRAHTGVEERWRVRGPAKSYDAFTTLVRLD